MFLIAIIIRNPATRYGLHQVLDVGCGEGSLLTALCNPAPWLATPDQDVTERFKILRVSHLHGLDISDDDLQNTIISTSAPAEPTSEYAYYSRATRWEPLQVNIWKGSLASVNEPFIGIESIVSTEVYVHWNFVEHHGSRPPARIILIFDARIEHLHDEDLSKFAPILLGVYHPRLLLITTPSYTFNARFTAPADGAPSVPSDEDSGVRAGGFLDPTRRTKRVFRHPDHKFEWTIHEFEEWCTTTARKWGYTVHTNGIGKPMEEDEWGRDSELGYATQTAVFTRLDGEEYAWLRAENARECLQVSPPGAQLLASHHHAPHPAATSPRQSSEVILNLVKGEIGRGEENKILLRYLWIEEVICCACSGRIDALIDVIKAAENVLQLQITDPGAREDWVVELIGCSRRKENLWEERQNDTAGAYDEMSDEEAAGGLEELEDIEWENDDTDVDVTLEPEQSDSSLEWGARAGGGDGGDGWGSRVDESAYGGWGGGWGSGDGNNSWTT